MTEQSEPSYHRRSTEARLVDPNRLEEAVAFERIRFLCLLYFCDGKFLELWGRIYCYAMARKDFEVLRAISIQYTGCRVFQR